MTLKSFPTSLEEMKREAFNLGLLNPLKEKEAANTPRGKLLTYSYNSYNINRCFNHVTMMLVGYSGVGKSATVNHLLGAGLASKSSSKSETRSTTEYVLTAPDPDLGLSNLSLVILTYNNYV